MTERAAYIGRIRNLARSVAQSYYDSRARLGFPMAPREWVAQIERQALSDNIRSLLIALAALEDGSRLPTANDENVALSFAARGIVVLLTIMDLVRHVLAVTDAIKSGFPAHSVPAPNPFDFALEGERARMAEEWISLDTVEAEIESRWHQSLGAAPRPSASTTGDSAK